MAMIIDETYKDFRSNPGPPHALVQKSFWHETLIQLCSFSKSLALTGFRVGAIAALYGLRHLDDWRRQKADILRGRVRRLRECFNRGDLEYQLGFSGTYFAYVKHPFCEAAGAYSVARRLAEEFGILSLPGSMFGPGQDAYLRFAFANIGSDQIPLLVDRLAASQEF